MGNRCSTHCSPAEAGPATLEAPERARAAAAEKASRVPPRRPQSGKRTPKQRAYERRRRQERKRKQRRAARLLAQGVRQEQAAAAVEVTTRTLRNWKVAPALQRELERQRTQAARQPTPPPSRATPPRPSAHRIRPAGSRRPGQTTARDPAQPARDRRPTAAEERTDAAAPPRAPAISYHDGVPIFPDTPDGRAARLAYYEARKLNNPPNSLLDYNDARRDREPPAERRARQRRDNRPRR